MKKKYKIFNSGVASILIENEKIDQLEGLFNQLKEINKSNNSGCNLEFNVSNILDSCNVFKDSINNEIEDYYDKTTDSYMLTDNDISVLDKEYNTETFNSEIFRFLSAYVNPYDVTITLINSDLEDYEGGYTEILITFN